MDMTEVNHRLLERILIADFNSTRQFWSQLSGVSHGGIRRFVGQTIIPPTGISKHTLPTLAPKTWVLLVQRLQVLALSPGGIPKLQEIRVREQHLLDSPEGPLDGREGRSDSVFG